MDGNTARERQKTDGGQPAWPPDGARAKGAQTGRKHNGRRATRAGKTYTAKDGKQEEDNGRGPERSSTAAMRGHIAIAKAKSLLQSPGVI